MAIEGSITLNELTLAEVGTDPSTGGGLDLPVGSMASLGDGVTARLWLKYSSGATDWARILIQASATDFTAGSVIFSDSDSNLIEDNTNFFWDNSSKRLGIGTNTPQNRLHIHNSATGGANFAYLRITNGDTGATSGDGLEIGVQGDEHVRIWNNENTSLIFATNATEKMRLLATGELGIGLNAPVSLLHVDAGTGNASQLRFTAGTTTGQASTDGLTFGIDASGNAEIRQYENLPMLFYTNNIVAGRFDASQRLIVGSGASQASSSTDQSRLQVQGTDAATTQAALMRWSADANSAALRFTKSRSGSIGTHTIVQAGDLIGEVSYRGSDGTNFITGATISALVDGTPGTNSMPTRLSFAVTPTGGSAAVEAFRVDSSGRFILSPAGSAAIDVTGAAFFPAFQILGNTPVTAQMLTASYSSDANPAVQNFLKSRNATIGSHTIVQNNDEIGRIQFRASNGTSFDLAASIRAFVDGTPGSSNDMPGRLVFYTTPDGSATIVERMRITNDGLVGIGNITPTRQLDVAQTIRIRGGNPLLGHSLQAEDSSGNATWVDRFDIGLQSHFVDDFLEAFVAAGYLGLSWSTVANGGTIGFASTNVNSTHPGTIEIANSANNQRPVIHRNIDGMIVGDGIMIIQWLIRTPGALPSGTQNYVFRIGLGDNTANDASDFVDGCYFEFPASGTTAIQCKTSSNSTRTTTSSGINWTTNTWYLLKMTITSSSVVYNINGTDVATITTNIPTNAGRNCGPIAKHAKTAGNGAVTWTIDAFRYSQYFSGTRY
ncbi:MAG: hypothetical protein QXL01_00400 [Thermoplasmatales archaeon]